MTLSLVDRSRGMWDAVIVGNFSDIRVVLGSLHRRLMCLASVNMCQKLATVISGCVLILWEELQFSGVSLNGPVSLMFEMYLVRISVYTGENKASVTFY